MGDQRTITLAFNIQSYSFHIIHTLLHSGRIHLGGGDKTVPRSLDGCTMDMFPQMAKE